MQVRIVGTPSQVRAGATFQLDDIDDPIVEGKYVTTLSIRDGADVTFTEDGETVTINSMLGVSIIDEWVSL